MTTWQHETIEQHNAEKGSVYVFRWVPDYAPSGGQHPTFDEWLDNMRGAAVGLDEPLVGTRVEYEDTVLYGVTGHRPMSEAERNAYAETLRGEIAYRQKCLDALSAGGTRNVPTE